MKPFNPPRVTLIWLSLLVVFWGVLGAVTVITHGEAWKAVLQFALAILCLLGLVIGTINAKRTTGK